LFCAVMMADERYRFCKISLQESDLHQICDLLTSLLGGQFEYRTLALADAGVDVMKNPDAGAAADFIGWPIIVEIEAGAGAIDAAILNLTTRILTAAWEAGPLAVAACDYEPCAPTARRESRPASFATSGGASTWPPLATRRIRPRPRPSSARCGTPSSRSDQASRLHPRREGRAESEINDGCDRLAGCARRASPTSRGRRGRWRVRPG
jgi:hypothetical protein